MQGRGTKTRASDAGTEATGVLNAEQTLKLLAMSSASAKRAEKAKPGIEALHNATFVQLPLGVGYANRDGTFIWCNAAFDRMLGLEPGDHRKKTIRDLTHAVDMPTNDQLLGDLWE